MGADDVVGAHHVARCDDGDHADAEIEHASHLVVADVTETLDLTDRRVIQRTSSGTQGVVAAAGAGAILLGSFVIAGATVRYLTARADEVNE